MRRRLRFLKRCTLWAVGLPLALLGLFYAVFTLLLVVTEKEWLGKAPFHEAIDVRLQQPHDVALLDDGRDSLATRLRLIESAERSIELEFFIYELDRASRIVTDALVRKAKAGVKVRLLVDFAAPVFKLRPAYARWLTNAGVAVRYYNTASMARIFAVQHRTHRKLLAVDDEVAIIGGRNVADDYFELSEHYNFLDSDLLVRGPVVKSMVKSFDLYWNSEWTTSPPDEEGPNPLQAEREDLELAASLRKLPPNHALSSCNDIQFVTDYPGSGVERRKVFPAIASLAREARTEVLVESPYFVLRPDGMDVIKGVVRSGVRMRVLTNSLRSTDAYYTVAALLPTLSDLNEPNFELWAYRGDPPTGRHSPASNRWGVHAKRAVFDQRTVVIGTYNIDPRSANLNSELIVICRGDTRLADSMRQSIEGRVRQSVPIVGTDRAGGVDAILADADVTQLAKLVMVLPIARFFDFLL